MSVFDQGQDTVGKVAIFMDCEWFLLELAKDRFLGVDSPPPGQHVSPCVWYGMTCQIIRSTSGQCLARLCGEGLFVAPMNHKVRRGPSIRNPSNVRGTVRALAGEPTEVRGLSASHTPTAGPAPPLARSHTRTPGSDLPSSLVTRSPETLPSTCPPVLGRHSSCSSPKQEPNGPNLLRLSAKQAPGGVASTTPQPPLLPCVSARTAPSPPRHAPAHLLLLACGHDRPTRQPPRHRRPQRPPASPLELLRLNPPPAPTPMNLNFFRKFVYV
jgi:hypothetical protein